FFKGRQAQIPFPFINLLIASKSEGTFMSLFMSLLSLLVKDALFFASYVKNNTFPQPLSPEEEEYYIEQMKKGSEYARNKLIEHNLRLVAHIVKKFNSHTESTEDLISIGTIGLIKGVERSEERRVGKESRAGWAAR